LQSPIPRSIVQINVSAAGGLPKTPVEHVFVSKGGLVGDYNKYRVTRLNGDPTSAVLLLPLETIEGFFRMGYAIAPGSMGENFTLGGVHYPELSIGRKLRLGKSREGKEGKEEMKEKAPIVRIERVCNPCDELLIYGKEFPKVAFGRRGMYASVEREGYVSKGDPFEFL
jgi:MOSC domain-containing protein YiiM